MNKAIQEREVTTLPGMLMVLLLLVFTAAAGWWVLVSLKNLMNPILADRRAGVRAVPVGRLLHRAAQPGGGAELFGKYVGTSRTTACAGTTPSTPRSRSASACATSRAASSRSTNSTAARSRSPRSSSGRCVDSAEAVFNVDDYENFVHIQTESALRAMATSYPYDQHEDGQSRCAAHPRGDLRAPEGRTPGAAERCRRAGASTRASATSPTRRRSPRRCCSGSRPTRSSPRARGSSTAPSAWSRWRSNCRRKASCSSTRSARRDGQQPAVVLCGERGDAADRQHRHAAITLSARCDGGEEGLSAAHQRRRPAARAALGRRRAAQPQRTDRIRPARRAAQDRAPEAGRSTRRKEVKSQAEA